MKRAARGSLVDSARSRSLMLVPDEQIGLDAPAFDGLDPVHDTVWRAEVDVVSIFIWSSKQRISLILRQRPPPRSLADVDRPCAAFSAWWNRATRGLRQMSARPGLSALAAGDLSERRHGPVSP
jgi:hypothetical protein